MAHFVIIGFQSLTIITKCAILDVATVLDPPLVEIMQAFHYRGVFRIQSNIYDGDFCENP